MIFCRIKGLATNLQRNFPNFGRGGGHVPSIRAVRKSIFQTERKQKRKPSRFRVYGTETEIQKARKFTETETERKNVLYLFLLKFPSFSGFFVALKVPVFWQFWDQK